MNLVQQLAKASATSPPKRVLGIDLGTTNSTVAQVQSPLDPAGSPELLCECISIDSVVKEFFTTAAGAKNCQPRSLDPEAINA